MSSLPNERHHRVDVLRADIAGPIIQIPPLSNSTPFQITQMKYRLTEGNGECFYYLGERSGDSISNTPPPLILNAAIAVSGNH